MVLIRLRHSSESRIASQGIAIQRWAITREHGQGLVEYALIVSVVAVLGVGGYSAAGGSLRGVLGRISSGTAGIVQPQTSTSTPNTTTVATTTTKKKKSH